MNFLKTINPLTAAALSFVLIALSSCETGADKTESELDPESLSSSQNSNISIDAYSLTITDVYGDSDDSFHSDSYNASKATDGDSDTWAALAPEGSITLEFDGRKVVDGALIEVKGGNGQYYRSRWRTYDPNTEEWSSWIYFRYTCSNDSSESCFINIGFPNTIGDRITFEYVDSSVGYVNFKEIEILGYAAK